LIDLEIKLVQIFHWSLRDIDETSVDSLLPFIFRLTGMNEKEKKVYCDQVDWL
jgi:hypothetical protein